MNSPAPADLAYQERILQGVSRTFALTIPQLPEPLVQVVGNAYLLCRIADTIEDDKHLPYADKRRFSEQFIHVVSGGADAGQPGASGPADGEVGGGPDAEQSGAASGPADSEVTGGPDAEQSGASRLADGETAGNPAAEQFARDLYPRLSPTATDSERDLIKNTPAVIRITHSFNRRQQAALQRCIRIMADGMIRYQETDVANGLKDQQDMDSYCYHVAGVVGEMLTELFCDYSSVINRNHDEMMELAVSFGQGLQMTNILKDIWDDQKRNMCWLPQSVLAEYGVELNSGTPLRNEKEFQQALEHLVGVARMHLGNALNYTLLLPAHEVGIRRFCLWALGMAILTLRKINSHRDFTSGNEVKISRRAVKATIISANLLTRRDVLLRWLFNRLVADLPVAGF